LRVTGRRLLLVFGGISMVATPFLARPAAAASESFSAMAEADGVRITVVANGGPLTSVPVDTGSPVAQATLDSLGSSKAFASQAYPGDEAITLPGTVAGVTKGAASLPHYPLIAESDASSQPSATVDQPGSSLSASSSPSGSKASAVTGAQSGDNRAGLTSGRADISQASDGAVTATGSSDTEAVAVGPLYLGRVLSSATVRVAPGSNASKSSTLEVTGASVAGVPISITPAGVTAGSSTNPLPSTSPLSDVLRNAGMSVTYIAPETTPSGIIAAGVKVTVSKDVPGPVSPVSVTYIFGQSAASVAGAADSSSQAATPAAADNPASQAGPSGAQTAPATPGSGGVTPAATSSGAGVLSAGSTARTERPYLALRTPASGARTSRRAMAGFDLSAFYLVVAVGAIAAAVMSRLVGMLGVKQWIS
jgi:hypothetical protein